jgi:hypothetical protein
MSKRLIVFFFGLAVFAAAFYAYTHSQAPPAGVEQKGSGDSMAAEYISLATAVVSLLTALAGLIKASLDKK